MPKRKQQPTFLPIFTDQNGKNTFAPFHVATVEEKNEAGENIKTMKGISNTSVKDAHGDDYFKPMNRAARRQRDRSIRLYEKKHGPRPTVKKEASNDQNHQSDGSSESKS